MNKHTVRCQGIAARNSLTPEERTYFSQLIVNKIRKSAAFKNAKTVMLYKAVRGEVSLAALENTINHGHLPQTSSDTDPETTPKLFIYPHCINNTDMIVLAPHDESAWIKGRFGILEPVPEKSIMIAPEAIDLVICPCTAFDKKGNRMGMGAGYYDRFLPQCKNAAIIAAAFECQKTDTLPMDPWDTPMESIFTEVSIYP